MSFFCYCDNYFRPYDLNTIDGALYGKSRCYINENTAAKVAQLTEDEKETLVNQLYSVNPLTHDIFSAEKLTRKQMKRISEENYVAQGHFRRVFGDVPRLLTDFSPIVPEDGQDFVPDDTKFPWVLPEHIRRTRNQIPLTRKLFHCKNGCRYHVTHKSRWSTKCSLCYKRHNYPGRPYGGKSWLSPVEMQFIMDLCSIVNDDRLHHFKAVEYAQVILDVFVHKTKPIPRPHYELHRETVNKTFYS